MGAWHGREAGDDKFEASLSYISKTLSKKKRVNKLFLFSV
jgi:hypothetical protein